MSLDVAAYSQERTELDPIEPGLQSALDPPDRFSNTNRGPRVTIGTRKYAENTHFGRRCSSYAGHSVSLFEATLTDAGEAKIRAVVKKVVS